MTPAPTPTLEAIQKGLSLYFQPDGVYEIRIFESDRKPGAASLLFDGADVEKAATAIFRRAQQRGSLENFCVTMNPGHPDLLAKKGAVGDDHILRRRRLVFDFDYKRQVTGISATEEELIEIKACAEAAREQLKEVFGWPDPIIIMSGNGYHLIYVIDLPSDDASKLLIERVLKAADALFRTKHVGIDKTIFNASRVIKVPGTVAKKGNDKPDRPHRLSQTVSLPPQPPFVSFEQLTALAAMAPEAEPKVSTSNGYHASASSDVAAFLQKYGIDHRGPYRHNGSEKYLLARCPFNPDHKDPDAAVFQNASGIPGFKCLHDSCGDKHWRDFREHYEPSAFRSQWSDAAPPGQNGIAGPVANAPVPVEPDQSQPAKKKSKKTAPPAADEPAKESQATKLIGMIHGVEFLHTPEGALFATFPIKNHHETHAIRSKAFRIYLQRHYYKQTRSVLGSTGLSDALGVFEGRAVYDGPEKKVFCRIAQHGDAVYIDLGDPEWRAIEVTPEGWGVVPEYPVKFRRAKGMLALPVPVKNDPEAEQHFRECLNVKTDADFALVKAWILGSLRPTGPYPVMWLTGPQGSAKTTISRVFRLLLDPNQAAMRPLPKEDRDFMIAASNSRLLALDNMSHLPDWASDSLCRVATGGGFATRELYSDSEETLFDVSCPVIINGIDEVMTRGDLIDRAVIVQLAQIPEDDRLPEIKFWARFEEYRPGILGYFLNALQAAMSNVGAVKLDRLPRMADFAQFVTAAEESFGWEPGYFLKIYDHNRAEANSMVLEASSVAQTLKTFLEQAAADTYQRLYQLEGKWEPAKDNREGGTWSGPAAPLLRNLNRLVTDEERRAKSWPKDARALSACLRRLVTNLKAGGLSVVFSRDKKDRDIDVSYEPNTNAGDAKRSDDDAK